MIASGETSMHFRDAVPLHSLWDSGLVSTTPKHLSGSDTHLSPDTHNFNIM